LSKSIGNIAADRQAIAGQSFHELDILLLPVTATTTLKIEDARQPSALSAENTMFANYYALPAVSVPCGFDKHGLPLGLQIVAKPWDEVAVLRLAHQVLTATGFDNARPPV
jgi:aspartyl-tRNA(Asn)/glutamyl-tRNA(Gln) amidotransferase subunit A